MSLFLFALFFAIFLSALLAFYLFLSSLFFFVHDSQDGQEPCRSNVNDVLVMFEQKAPITDVLPTLFVVFVKIGLFL